jgi:putative phosphoribosyl transferase
MGPVPSFADRAEAGRELAAALPAGLGPDTVVLGLARGGVPVAAEVAGALGARLDVLVVRKVGHPAQPEYALGAVSEDGVALPADLPEEVVAPRVERAREQARALRGARPRVEIEGAEVVVVDDGLATGRSMLVALETVAHRGAKRIIAAVPVAAAPNLQVLAERFEVCAVAAIPPPGFRAVGQFYADFTQVEDEAVARLLAAAA